MLEKLVFLSPVYWFADKQLGSNTAVMHTPVLTSFQIAAERERIFSSTYETSVYLENDAAPESRTMVKLSRGVQNEISVIYIYVISSSRDTSNDRGVSYLFVYWNI